MLRAPISSADTLWPKSSRTKLLTMLLLSAVATPAFAAEEDPQQVDSSEIIVMGQKQDGYGTDRITTATRTGTDLRDIPQSVQVVPRQVIDDRQLVDLTSVVTNVSGIQSAGTSGNRSETFTVRGFKASAYAVDGIVLNPAVSNSDVYRDLSYVERVEVLKGPASVLYGRGDPGGLINIVTKQPQFSSGRSVSAQVGSNDFYRGELDLTGPIVADTLAFRLIGAYQQQDTFRDFLIPEKRIFVAPSLLLTPGSRTRILITGAYANQRVQSDRGLPVVRDAATGLYSVAGPQDGFYGEKWAQTKTERYEIGYRIEHEANSWLTLRQIGSYSNSSINQKIVNFTAVAPDGHTLRRGATSLVEKDHSIDLQLDAVAKFSTAGVGHTLVIGGEYTDGTRDLVQARATLASLDLFAPTYGALPGGFVVNNDRLNTVEILAGYIQDQIDLGDQVKILAGARYDHSKQVNSALGQVVELSNDRISPRIGVVYKAIPAVSLFADYTRSFQPNAGVKFGGGNFDPEIGRQYEIGVKADLLGDRLSLTTAIYDLRRENVLTNDPANAGFQIQTGVQRSRGVEIDVNGRILPGWNVIASGSYIDAKIVADTLYTPGARLQNVPHWSGSIWSNYDVQSGSLRGLGGGAGISGVTDRSSDLANTMTLAGYTRVDAGIHYDLAKLGRISLSVKNLFDTFYIDTPGIGTGATLGLYPGASRTFQLGLRANL